MRPCPFGSSHIPRVVGRRRSVLRAGRCRHAADGIDRSLHQFAGPRTATARRSGAGATLLDEPDDDVLCAPLPFAPATPSDHEVESRGGARMKCVLFYHAFTSCWNNGNAHFLRGISRELSKLGHDVVVYEPADGWSRVNAIRDRGQDVLMEVSRLFPDVTVRSYDQSLDLDEALEAA